MDPMEEDHALPPPSTKPPMASGHVPVSGAGMIEAGIAAGNISRQGDGEVMDLPEVRRRHPSPSLLTHDWALVAAI